MSNITDNLRSARGAALFRELEVSTPDGVKVAVQDWRRPGSRHDVLLIHGFAQSHLSWLKQVGGPLASEFRLVTYDLRGHGNSDKPARPEYYRESIRWADELGAVMDSVQLDRPTLVCWSYAGRVVLDYLSHRGDSQIAAIVFVDATSKADPTVLGPAAPLLREMTAEDLSTNIEATTAFLKAATARPLPEDDLRYMLAMNMAVPAYVRENLVGRAADYEASLRKITVPVLVMHGAEDRINSPAMAEYTREIVPHAQLVMYPETGHIPFWEKPHLFDRDLGDFLRSIARE